MHALRPESRAPHQQPHTHDTDATNTSKSIALDPNFAKVYLPEKRLVLEVLKEGDPILWAQAFALSNQ